jgi:phosphatidylethanolamine/phosphatidyl-N-methylethanolamine N-methyltransferase
MSKDSEVDAFYKAHYKEIMGTGLISRVWASIHRQMERPFEGKFFSKILELGAGNGEHIPFIGCDFENYTATDIRIDNLINITRDDSRITVEVQDAHKLNFADNTFDRVIITCLLAHLDRPEEAISEVRRVLKREGSHVTIYLPCEPGILLRFTRSLSTHLKARKRGVSDISRLHFLEHRNYYLALDNLISYEFEMFKIKKRYYPFPFLTWNSNLYRIYQISTIS